MSIVRWPGVRAVYDLTVYDLKSVRWNDLPGVYVFAKFVDGTWYPVYIGQCGSFMQRLCAAHHKWTSALFYGATHVHAMVEKDEARRRSIEVDLLANFNTPCNELLN